MLRALDKWLPGYLASLAGRPRAGAGLRHLLFCVVDHFEPHGRGASPEQARATMERWSSEWPRLAAGFRDADGRQPVHTFFYPAEEYQAPTLDALAVLTQKGLGEVEVHLHHRGDTAQTLSAQLLAFRRTLRERHGLLGQDRAGSIRYGFIHGNWALCNSRPDGDWCGVDAELRVLRETGCYADFTFPSAPSPTQPRTVNAIYYAQDGADGPRGHDRGVAAARGHSGLANDPNRLLLIQGPLALNWHRRKWGLLPRLENADLSGANPPTAERLALWTAPHIHVQGQSEWIFVKVHTHGAVRANADVLLGQSMVRLHQELQARYNDGQRWQLHYVSAREMANCVFAAEQGVESPSAARDQVVLAPPCRTT